MNLTFAAQLNKMITAGLGGAVEAPETGVAVGRRTEYTSIGPAPILTFEANLELPLKALSITMEPIQEGTGDPSPENVRPISGRQSVTVTRAGANVWDEEWELGYYNQQGDAVPSNTNIRSKNPISVVPNTEYFLKTSGVTIYICQYDASGRFIAEAGRQSATDAVFVTNVNARFIKFNLTTRYGTTYNHDISINYPPTDHDYHPGTVASVEIPLGQTVYGGTVDVTSGVLTVDRAMVDLGTLNWAFRDSGTVVAPYFYSPIESLGVKYEGSFQTVAYNILCSIYKSVSRDTVNFVDGTVCVDGTQSEQKVTQFQIKDSRYSDAESFKTAMNGVQLVYELAEPITVQLTSEQLTTVLGTNNVWSDADEVSLIYGNIYYTEGY